MNLRCFIIDDETHAIELLARFIKQTPGLELAGSTTKPLETLPLFGQPDTPDISFLDIDMPGLNGLDLARLINGQTSIVFTTSYREFAPEAFDVEAADYLLKPIAYERFLTAIQKIRQLQATQASDHLFARTGSGQLTRIEIADIIYISGLLNYVEIYSKNQKVIAYISLAELLELLPGNQFSRIHKSYIIHHQHIHQIINDEVLLSNTKRLTIGRAYRKTFLAVLSNNLLRNKRDHRF